MSDDFPTVVITCEKGSPKRLEINGRSLDGPELTVNTEFETACLTKVTVSFYTDDVTVVST